MNTWLHRISHHAEAAHPLLDKGFLTIGFSDFQTQEFLEKCRARDWSYFDAAFAREWPDHPKPRTRHTLARFISSMAVGDQVLVPSWGTFSVFRITSDARLISALPVTDVKAWGDRTLTVKKDGLYIQDTALDLGFFREVEPIESNISRYKFADGPLTARMKYQMTNADITDLSESVRQSVEAARANRPINLHSQILDSSRDSVLKLIQEQLDPGKFERLIKWYFDGIGATSAVIPPKNEAGKEGDADVVATFEPLKTIYCVQAKFHLGETDKWAVQQIREFKDQRDRMDDGYTRIAWVVSSAPAFSEECKKLAKENSVGLFAGPDLSRMILEAGIEGLDKAFE